MGAADFIVRLGLNSTAFTSGKDRAKADLRDLQSSVNGAFERFQGFKQSIGTAFRGAAFAAPLLAIFKAVDERLDTILAKAKDIKIGVARTGLDSTQFQQVSNVMESKGSSIDKFESSSEKVADAMQTIRDGQDAGAKLEMAFARLGVSMDDIKNKNHQQVWLQIAENMRTVELTTERLAAMKDVFGKGGGELIPTFKAGFNTALANRGVLSSEELQAAEEERSRQKAFDAPWDAALNEGATSKWLTLPRWAYRAARHPFKTLGAATFGLARKVGYLDDSEFSTADQSARIDDLERRDTEATIRKNKEKARRDMLVEADKRLQQSRKEIESQRLSLLEGPQRKAALQARAAQLQHEIGLANTDIAAGDENHEKEIKRNKLMMERENILNEIRGRRNDSRGISLLPEGVDSRTRIGLFQGGGQEMGRLFAPVVSELQTHTSELRQLLGEIRNLREDYRS